MPLKPVLRRSEPPTARKPTDVGWAAVNVVTGAQKTGSVDVWVHVIPMSNTSYLKLVTTLVWPA
jgi:hypothetical protein